MATSDGLNRLKSGFHQYIKMYIEYDGSNRAQYVYEAPVGTVDGGPCIKTTYEYVGATTKVQKMKEEDDVWDATWDI